MRQALYIAHSNRVAVNDEDDRDIPREFLGRGGFRRREGDDQIYLKTDEFGGQRWQPIEMPVSRAVLYDEILATDPPQLGQALIERRRPLSDRRQAP